MKSIIYGENIFTSVKDLWSLVPKEIGYNRLDLYGLRVDIFIHASLEYVYICMRFKVGPHLYFKMDGLCILELFNTCAICILKYDHTCISKLVIYVYL